MDLRSGHAYWLLKNGLLGAYPSLREDISCDVAVLGGGITGALTAYHLAREGIDRIVIDQRDVGTGLIVDQYVGRKNPDARLFAFDR